MLKNFKKIIFRTTAIAASSLCLGAFTFSPLNASGPENSEEIYNEVYGYLEKEKKLFKNGQFPEYDAKTNTLGKYGECYDFVPIPQARIEYASRMNVYKNPEVRVVRMLAYNKNDEKAGNLDIIRNLSDDERNKLFDEYDLNSTQDKIDVVIEVYDLEKNREKPTKNIHTKMRKITRTIKNHNFVEFDLEMPTDCGFIPADVPVGRLKLYKTDGSDRKCISDVYYSANDLRDLKGKSFFKEKDLFINCVMRFNKSVNDMLMNSIINFNRNIDEEIEKSGKELLPEYDAQTNTLGKYGECFDLVPIPQTGISYKAGNNNEFVVQRMLAFDKKDKKPGNLDTIKDLLDDKNKLFEEYDPYSTQDKIDVVIEVFDDSKGDEKISNVINAKMRKISRNIKGHKFVEFAIERPANCDLVPADVPIGMVRLYKTDGSKRKYMSSVNFAGADALKSESDMFVDSIMHFNEGQFLLKDGFEDGEELDDNAKG